MGVKSAMAIYMILKSKKNLLTNEVILISA